MTKKTSATRKPATKKAAGGTKDKGRPAAKRTRAETAPKRAAKAGGGGTRAAARHDDALDAARAAIDAALDKKAFVPVLLDVSGRASYTDFIGVVSGKSDRQVEAIAEGVRECMKGRGFSLIGREGSGNGRWTLLDFGDVVVHVFYHPVREVYDIEGLWMDAPRVKLEVPPEAMHVTPDALYGG